MKNDEALPLENGRVTLWAEPGKHAHFASRDAMKEREAHTRYECSLGRGYMVFIWGIHSRKNLMRSRHMSTPRTPANAAFDDGTILRRNSALGLC